MFQRLLLLILLFFGFLAQANADVEMQGYAKSKARKSATITKKVSKKTHKQSHKKGGRKKKAPYKKKSYSRKRHGKYNRVVHHKVIDTVRKSTLQVIASNKEKSRVSDSVHQSIIISSSKNVEEGYFANIFSNQKKATSIQTLEGTASIFKSISGWQDKKFYILTNEIPVGTIVRITTADLKSICAKVINALPDVSSSIQYRLSDAAAAILGITNKTFQISVTY